MMSPTIDEILFENGLPIHIKVTVEASDYPRRDEWCDYIVGEDIILMQFTGLKDKNGKEIYEGDILDNEGARQKYEVIFHKGCFCIIQGGLGYHIFNEKKVEIIGNIYENKDLLSSLDTTIKEKSPTTLR